MPLTAGKYTKRTAEDILSFLEAELRAEFGEDIDLTEKSAFRTFAQALATSDSQNVETALADIFSAAAIEDAEDENLERLVAIVGVERREAVNATGVVEFDHGGIADQDYPISEGTIVQTNADDPIEFELTEGANIQLFDDFEGGALDAAYTEDTASFSVVDGTAGTDPTPVEGSFELKAAATAGVKIVDDANVLEIGCTLNFQVYLQNSGSGGAIAQNLFGVTSSGDYYQTVLDAGGTHKIEVNTVSGGTSVLQSSSVTIPENEWLHNEIVWSPEDGGTIISRIYDSSDVLVDEIQVTGEDTIEEGGFGFGSGDANENKYWDHSGLSTVMADARSRVGGVSGNLGANSLVVLESTITGVTSVTNPYPTGDSDHYLTDLTQYTAGLPRETDNELRERTTRSDGLLGKATMPSLIANMLALEGAESVTVFENDTDTDNTGTGGLPAVSFEVVFYGTTPDSDVAEAIFDTKAFTARDYGGANGTAKSETVIASNGQTFTINWSEPTALDIDMTLDLVVNENYIGDDEIRDRVIDYIGGTKTDGTSVVGTGVGEDVYIHQLQDAIVGPDDTGVIGVDESGTSFTPAQTTDANGLNIVDVGANEVGQTNGVDGSITITTTVV